MATCASSPGEAGTGVAVGWAMFSRTNEKRRTMETARTQSMLLRSGVALLFWPGAQPNPRPARRGGDARGLRQRGAVDGIVERWNAGARVR